MANKELGQPPDLCREIVVENSPHGSRRRRSPSGRGNPWRYRGRLLALLNCAKDSTTCAEETHKPPTSERDQVPCRHVQRLRRRCIERDVPWSKGRGGQLASL